MIIDESLGVAGGFVATASNGGEAPGGAQALRHGVFYAPSDRMAGPAVVWALRSGVDHLHLVAEPEHAGPLARRTADVDGLRIDVLEIVGTELVPAVASEITPAPELERSAWELASIITEAGARAVDDHGRIVAEVAGLEVARIVKPDGQPAEIEVGVGEADRELHGLVHTAMDRDTAVRRAIAMVAAERRKGSHHPLSRMARERWLRSFVLDHPALVGVADLEPVPPLRARSTVLGNVPVAAIGTRVDGSPVVVVCSTGIDLDVVPEAADYRRRHDPAADLIVVVPDRDRHATTEMMVASTPRAELVTIPPPW